MSDIITKHKINDKIHQFRDVHVMLDRDLAELYQVDTRTLNQAVKRNIERFPQEFMFQLTKEEFEHWRSQFVISNKEKMGLRWKPYVFTEQGVAMLAGVLKSEIAIKTSIQIINAFVQMRRFIVDNALIHQRMDKLEKQQLVTETKLEQVFQAIENKDIKPQSGVFFDGQIFDAHTFIADLIRKAKKSLILIDNYIDDTVLTQLSKSSKKIQIYILTKNISNQLKLDVKKYGEQYSTIELIEFNLSHDRFLIIDEDIYHIGASLKDLGKKWFAFSKLEKNCLGLMTQVKKIIQENKQK